MNFQDLKKRFFVSTFIVVLFIFCIYFSQFFIFKPIFAIIVSYISFFATLEFLSLVQKKGIFINKNILACCSFLFVFSFYLSFIFNNNFIPIYFFISIFFILFILHLRKVKNSIINISVSIFSLIYISMALGFFLKIPVIWMGYLIVVVKIGDIFAYFFGRWIGKRKLLVQISPKKTFEGGIASILFSMAASAIYSVFLLKINFLYAIFLGAILSIVGQMGDFFESLLKRDADIKDSGNIKGLGGILDMLDSLLFNVYVVYFSWSFFI